MTAYRTQCPQCQHKFGISDTQLTLKDGYARCSQCLQIFLALDHLLPITPSFPPPTVVLPDPIAQKSPAVPPPSQSTPSVPIIDKRDEPQITPVRSSTRTPVKASKILTTAIPSPRQTPDLAEPQVLFDDHIGLANLPDDSPKAARSTSEFNFDILEDFEKLSVPTTSDNQLDKTTPSLPPSTLSQKNTYQANDEAWLEALLNEENQKQLNTSYFDKQKNPATPAHASDVASLLEDFGVEMAPEKPLSPAAYQEKVNQRLTHLPTPQVVAEKTAHLGMMTGLWLVGSLLLLLGLLIQYVAYNADSIAKSPAQATTVRGLCDSLHLPCNIPYADPLAVDTKLISIDAKADKSDVMIMLINQSNLTQLYPTLKLTLQANNSPVAQMIATPAQYLDDHTKTLNPQQLKPIKLRLDLPHTKFDKVSIEKLY